MVVRVVLLLCLWSCACPWTSSRATKGRSYEMVAESARQAGSSRGTASSVELSKHCFDELYEMVQLTRAAHYDNKGEDFVLEQAAAALHGESFHVPHWSVDAEEPSRSHYNDWSMQQTWLSTSRTSVGTYVSAAVYTPDILEDNTCLAYGMLALSSHFELMNDFIYESEKKHDVHNAIYAIRLKYNYETTEGSGQQHNKTHILHSFTVEQSLDTAKHNTSLVRLFQSSNGNFSVRNWLEKSVCPGLNRNPDYDIVAKEDRLFCNAYRVYGGGKTVDTVQFLNDLRVLTDCRNTSESLCAPQVDHIWEKIFAVPFNWTLSPLHYLSLDFRFSQFTSESCSAEPTSLIRIAASARSKSIDLSVDEPLRS